MDFAAIRAKAEQAASAARTQLQRPSPPSRYTSSTSAAPPSHRPPLAAAAAAPPPPSRRTAPSNAATQADKDALFSALDEFFSSRLGIQIQPPAPAPAPAPARPQVAPKPARRSAFIAVAVPEAAKQPAPVAPAPTLSSGPPPISRATRPQLSPALAPPASRPDRSYPPAETHSSAALSLLHWLLDPPNLSSILTTSAVPFFLPPPASPSPQPPPLENRSDVRSAYSWLQRGDAKSYVGCFLFGDASIAWIRISWNATAEARGPTALLRGGQVQREGRYRPRPRIEHDWDAERLYRASETYGPRIVRFAQDALARGVPVARGECWDLANEAIAACEADKIGDAPFPSIARTHGALLYYARAGTGEVVGTWTGGDVYVRPGDIVEWRSVTIREVGMAPGSYSTLGDPEHTAIIVAAGAPLTLPRFDPSGRQPPFLDTAYPLSSLVSLTVVEQSRGYAPSEKTYDLAAMSKGEVWIYRPCGLRDLVGVDEVAAKWPPEVQCWQVGELE